MEIENNSPSDALVVLVESGEGPADRAGIYVRARSKAVLGNVPPGSFVLAYELGEDWNPNLKRFNNSIERGRFEELAEFEETPSEYKEIQVTLHALEGGKLRPAPAEQARGAPRRRVADLPRLRRRAASATRRPSAFPPLTERTP